MQTDSTAEQTPTPGPWSVELTIAGDTILTSGSETLAFLVGDSAQVLANAELMAAAPDLLAALIGLRALIIGECGASMYECIDGERADAAIQKATAP